MSRAGAFGVRCALLRVAMVVVAEERMWEAGDVGAEKTPHQQVTTPRPKLSLLVRATPSRSHEYSAWRERWVKYRILCSTRLMFGREI